MKTVKLSISSNTRINSSIWRMRLTGDVSAVKQPGQFVNIALNGHYLRRPISVCNCSKNSITLLYKVVGEGTTQMSQMKRGEQLEILSGLGNGFSTDIAVNKILLVGGGIGIAPLYWLAKQLIQQGKEVQIALCYNTATEVFYASEFAELGAEVYIATVDGSMGTKGFITDLLKETNISFDFFYACGPMPMLRALCQNVETKGEVSLEARMGCGFGICMGCTIQTTNGNKRVCKEGPVFRKEEIVW